MKCSRYRIVRMRNIGCRKEGTVGNKKCSQWRVECTGDCLRWHNVGSWMSIDRWENH